MQHLAEHYRKNARNRSNSLEVRCYYEVADIIDGRQPAVESIETHLKRRSILMAPQGGGDIYKDAANEVFWVRQIRGRVYDQAAAKIKPKSNSSFSFLAGVPRFRGGGRPSPNRLFLPSSSRHRGPGFIKPSCPTAASCRYKHRPAASETPIYLCQSSKDARSGILAPPGHSADKAVLTLQASQQVSRFKNCSAPGFQDTKGVVHAACCERAVNQTCLALTNPFFSSRHSARWSFRQADLISDSIDPAVYRQCFEGSVRASDFAGFGNFVWVQAVAD